MNIEKIMKENKRYSNYFLDTLKTGNKEKLDAIFTEARKNNINLFNYTGLNNEVVECIIKQCVKIFKDKNIVNSIRAIDDWLKFLKTNGFNLCQKDFNCWNHIAKEIKYNHLFELRRMEYITDSYQLSIISKIMLENFEEEFIKIIPDDDFMKTINESFFLRNKDFVSIFKKMYDKGLLTEKIFQLNKLFLNNILKKDYYFRDEILGIDALDVFKKQINANMFSESSIEYFHYLLENDKDNEFLIKFQKISGLSTEDLSILVLDAKKLNLEWNKYNLYSSEDKSFDFINYYSPDKFAHYINKIITFNKHSSEEEKIKMNGIFKDKNKNNNMIFIRYFSPTNTNSGDLLLEDSEIKNFLIHNELLPEGEDVKYFFNIIHSLRRNDEYSIGLGTFSFLLSVYSPIQIKNFIPYIKKSFINNSFKENSWSKDTITKKIGEFLNHLEPKDIALFVKDMPLDKVVSILSKYEKSDELFKKDEKLINLFYNVNLMDKKFEDKIDNIFDSPLLNIIKHYLQSKGINIHSSKSLYNSVQENIKDFIKLLKTDKKKACLLLKVSMEKNLLSGNLVKDETPIIMLKRRL